MNEGVNNLAAVLQTRMRELNGGMPVVDFGTIRADMSLVADAFPVPIPQRDYIICRSLISGPVDSVIAKTGTNSGHEHDVLVYDYNRQIQPGDRVLVAWRGNDACVIDIILPATAIRPEV